MRDGSEIKPSFFLGEGEVHITRPDGRDRGVRTHDAREAHTIEIHEDGSITVSPSFVMPLGWHGWLRRGVLTEA
jgi:hypothetical protein